MSQGYHPPSPPNYAYNDDAFNSKIMVASIIILFLVVFFILSLHLYAKWFWRHPSSLMISNRRLGQETNSAAAYTIGLDKAAIDLLPTFIYKAPVDEEGGLALLECAVCLSEFQENEKGRLLPSCKHSFHTDCIDMWFFSHSTCPLCRTAVSMPTPLSASTSEQQQQQQQGEELQQEGSPMEAPISIHNDPVCTLQPTINHGNANHTQVTSHLGSSQGLEKPSTSSAIIRSIPHITIEIPRRQDNCISPSCLSKLSSLSRCPSPNDQACSSQLPIESPGLRMSFKRMLSRKSSKGRRVFGSNQESEDSLKDTTTLPV